jgi:hypothetical protein
VDAPDESDRLPAARDFLADARHDFPQFYATATPTDQRLLDGLIIAHAALVIGMNVPRQICAPDVRGELERATDRSERAFTKLREIVRACPTFQNLIAAERAEIERDVFTVLSQVHD